MPQYAKSLDIYQGFNFKKDKQTPVGYITKLVVGDVPLEADQSTIKDPEQPGADLGAKVVGVLSHFLWETGTTDAMYMSAQISTSNKQALAAKLLTDWTNMEVTFSYVVYEYDPRQKKYFKSNHQDAELKGILEKNGNDLNLTVADDPSREVQSPENYSFQIGVKPQPTAQAFHLATGVGQNFVKSWGLKVG